MITKFKIFESTQVDLKVGDKLRCIQTFGDALLMPDIPKYNKFYKEGRTYEIYDILPGIGFKPEKQYFVSTIVRYKGGVEKPKYSKHPLIMTELKRYFVHIKEDVEALSDPYSEEQWEGAWENLNIDPYGEEDWNEITEELFKEISRELKNLLLEFKEGLLYHEFFNYIFQILDMFGNKYLIMDEDLFTLTNKNEIIYNKLKNEADWFFRIEPIVDHCVQKEIDVFLHKENEEIKYRINDDVLNFNDLRRYLNELKMELMKNNIRICQYCKKPLKNDEINMCTSCRGGPYETWEEIQKKMKI